MLRWLFLFLLLANVVVLFWFSSFTAEKNKNADNGAAQLQSIRLVSEMDPTALVSRDSLKGKKEPAHCVYFIGFESQVNAEAVIEFLREQGINGTSIPGRKSSSSYIVETVVAQGLSDRMLLLDYMDSHGIEGEADELESGANLVLGRFSVQSEAKAQLRQLDQLGLTSVMRIEKRWSDHISVMVYESVDRKLSKEIKEVVQERYSLRKIEKKLCEGVAKP
ncbi:hypothetical protein [Neptuniibacter sp.]|uniref:hypothetical protein n=1 Tax=Neptuniibacter sp. TaxID=1962643 RepID=UPI00261B5D53|nr:hypothetical protein [Neptuniibacter sp.]MCP4597472.1 hypothetical protein [Neptuniibacter sp.]